MVHLPGQLNTRLSWDFASRTGTSTKVVNESLRAGVESGLVMGRAAAAKRVQRPPAAGSRGGSTGARGTSSRASAAAVEDQADGLAAELRALLDVSRERRELVLRETELVESIRRRGGSWKLIGDVLGVSAQAVQQRYGARLGQ